MCELYSSALSYFGGLVMFATELYNRQLRLLRRCRLVAYLEKPSVKAEEAWFEASLAYNSYYPPIAQQSVAAAL